MGAQCCVAQDSSTAIIDDDNQLVNSTSRMDSKKLSSFSSSASSPVASTTSPQQQQQQALLRTALNHRNSAASTGAPSTTNNGGSASMSGGNSGNGVSMMMRQQHKGKSPSAETMNQLMGLPCGSINSNNKPKSSSSSPASSGGDSGATPAASPRSCKVNGRTSVPNPFAKPPTHQGSGSLNSMKNSLEQREKLRVQEADDESDPKRFPFRESAKKNPARRMAHQLLNDALYRRVEPKPTMVDELRKWAVTLQEQLVVVIDQQQQQQKMAMEGNQQQLEQASPLEIVGMDVEEDESRKQKAYLCHIMDTTSCGSSEATGTNNLTAATLTTIRSDSDVPFIVVPPSATAKANTNSPTDMQSNGGVDAADDFVTTQTWSATETSTHTCGSMLMSNVQILQPPTKSSEEQVALEVVEERTLEAEDDAEEADEDDDDEEEEEEDLACVEFGLCATNDDEDNDNSDAEEDATGEVDDVSSGNDDSSASRIAEDSANSATAGKLRSTQERSEKRSGLKKSKKGGSTLSWGGSSSQNPTTPSSSRTQASSQALRALVAAEQQQQQQPYHNNVKAVLQDVALVRYLYRLKQQQHQLPPLLLTPLQPQQQQPSAHFRRGSGSLTATPTAGALGSFSSVNNLTGASRMSIVQQQQQHARNSPLPSSTNSLMLVKTAASAQDVTLHGGSFLSAASVGGATAAAPGSSTQSLCLMPAPAPGVVTFVVASEAIEDSTSSSSVGPSPIQSSSGFCIEKRQSNYVPLNSKTDHNNSSSNSGRPVMTIASASMASGSFSSGSILVHRDDSGRIIEPMQPLSTTTVKTSTTPTVVVSAVNGRPFLDIPSPPARSTSNSNGCSSSGMEDDEEEAQDAGSTSSPPNSCTSPLIGDSVARQSMMMTTTTSSRRSSASPPIPSHFNTRRSSRVAQVLPPSSPSAPIPSSIPSTSSFPSPPQSHAAPLLSATTANKTSLSTPNVNSSVGLPPTRPPSLSSSSSMPLLLPVIHFAQVGGGPATVSAAEREPSALHPASMSGSATGAGADLPPPSFAPSVMYLTDDLQQSIEALKPRPERATIGFSSTSSALSTLWRQ